jgi:hypothetical protein
MPAPRLLVAATSLALLALLASCAGDMTKPAKPIVYQGRVLTGETAYYHRGYTPPPAPANSRFSLTGSQPNNSSHTPLKLKGLWPFSGSENNAATVSSGATHGHGTTFANPDGTTSRVEYGAMIRSDGRKDWIIGNTVFHSDGTRSRIVGDKLIAPDGAISRKVQ